VVRVLAALCATAPLAVTAAPRGREMPVLPLVLPRERAPALDLEATRARTAEYAAAVARHRAFPDVSGVPAAAAEPDVHALLERVQREVGEPPGLLGRAFGGIRADTPAAREALGAAARTLRADADGILRQLEAVAGRGGGSAGGPSRAVLVERLEDAERRLESIARDLEPARGGLAGAAQLVRRWTWRDAPTELLALRERLRTWRGPDTRVLGAELTYVHGGAPPAPLPAATVVPAYLAGVPTVPALEDTSLDREVEVTPEVATKAAELGTPKAAYEFVKNELRLEWYHGVLRGSAATLREGAGNDADLAALLVALLRAQGVPARFVTGTIELPLTRAADLMGLLTAGEVDAIAAGGALPEHRAAQVVAVLTSAGVPFEAVTSGGSVRAVRLLHVWVEAYLPYADYRGVGASREGLQWVPLEPSITGTAKYVAAAPEVDVLAEMGRTAAQLTDEWLASGTSTTPLSFWRSQVEAHLAERHPGMSFEQAVRRVEPRAERLDALPGTLPYAVVQVHSESAFLPDDLKHEVRIAASDGAGTLFDVTLPAHQVAGHRAVLTYRPATVADHELLGASGGPYRAPASAVALVAVVRVDGNERAVASRSVGLGTVHGWSLELRSPNGAKRAVHNEVIAGNLVALGVAAGRNGWVDGAAPDADGLAARFLYGRAAAYATLWTEAEDVLASLLGVVPVRPTANVAFVQYQLAVREVLGVREAVVWKGLEVDADLRTLTPVELQPGRGSALLRLAGWEGSALEARVLSDAVGQPAISAVTLLGEARRQGVAVVALGPGSGAAELGAFEAPPDVRREIEDAIARGHEVLVPARPLTVEDWTGTGFVAREPTTEEGGYFLSGMVSGGQTIVSPGAWLDAALVELLERPDAPAAVADPARIARIVKVPATDLQRGQVGEILARPLRVYVTTVDGVPVKDAPVQFRVYAGSGATLSSNAQEAWVSSIQVFTRGDGSAEVLLRPDTDILHLNVEERPDPTLEPQLVGWNVVLVETSDGTSTITTDPFVAIGLPGPPAQFMLMQNASEYFRGVVGLDLGAELSAYVQDRYGNLLANQTVWWQAAPGGVGLFRDPALSGGTHVPTYDPSDPSQVPVLVQRTGTIGRTHAGFVVGWTPGAFRIVLQCENAIGEYHVLAQRPEVPYASIVRVPLQGAFAGILKTSFLSPYTHQVLQLDEASGRWSPLRGDESHLRKFGASMELLRQDGLPIGYPYTENPWVEQQRPADVLTGPAGAYDDDRTLVWWPDYVVAEQKIRIEAWLTAVVGGTVQTFWGKFEHEMSSDHASLTRTGAGEDGQPVEASRCLPAVKGGLLTFRVGNPASYPIYVEILEQPEIPGERLLELPGPEKLVRHPEDPSLVRVLEFTTANFGIPVRQTEGGGKVVVRLLVPDRKSGPTLRMRDEMIVRLHDAGSPLQVPDRLLTKVILPVRNFARTRNGDQLRPPSSAEAFAAAPVIEPAHLEFCAPRSGPVSVTLDGSVIAAGTVSVTNDGQLVGVEPDPERPLMRTDDGLLTALVPPGAVTGSTVRISIGQTEPLTAEVPLETRVEDGGPRPIGHTLVKDVSVVDGHLTKQMEDLRVPGRGGGLVLARAYTSRGFEESPLGRGWTHSYRSYLFEAPPGPAVVGNTAVFGRKLVVVGGDGSALPFVCVPDGACVAPEGFHGTLTPSGARWVFRSKAGVEHRYGPVDDSERVPRWPLEAIVDPAGNELRLEYTGSGTDREVARVFEPGGQRYLAFAYEKPEGAPRRQLTSVTLMSASTPGQAGPDAPLGVCVGFAYDARQNVRSATRYDGTCLSGQPVRTESYAYVESPNPALQNNLRAYTDANGNTTEYLYYTRNDALPGESAFVLMGDKEERVRGVREPEGVATLFTYSLSSKVIPSLGAPAVVFETLVEGPRPGIPATIYRLSSYGSPSQVSRTVAPGLVATASTEWDPRHLVPTREADPRGRITASRYDDHGNLVERRVFVDGASAAAGDDLARFTEQDGTAPASDALVEKWAYDATFSRETCRVDAAGRVSLTAVDGATGLPLSVTRRARPASLAALASDAPCAVVAASAPAAPGEDAVTAYRYCGVNGACPAGARPGDLVETRHGGRRTVIEAYDAYGSPKTVRNVLAFADVVTELTHDERSRLRHQTDSSGHDAWLEYDALDRVVVRDTRDSTGTSPGEYRTFGYHPRGEPRSEGIGTAAAPGSILSRTFELDGLNRTRFVRERGAGLEGELVTEYRWDQAGNRIGVVDRRGVLSATRFDWGDRPVEVRVSIDDQARYAAQRGSAAPVGLGGVVATYAYDVAGNRTSETDVHGHRTDYVLDRAYRAVKQVSPEVPDHALGSATRVRHTTARRFDRAGNKVWEQDGNGQATTFAYDHADRLVETVDPLGRYSRRHYDPSGDLVWEERGAGAVPYLSRTTAYDGLGRPEVVTEEVAGPDGPRTYTATTRYDDAARRVATRDRRGFVTVRELDGLDRVRRETVDEAGTLLERRPDDARAGAALGLVTTYEHDAGGRRVATVDAEGRRLEEQADALGRVTSRRRFTSGAPRLVAEETFEYDGEGNVVRAVDRRGIERLASFDAIGRGVQEQRVERLTGGGATLTTLAREYDDAAGRVTERDALNRGTVRTLDGLHREIAVRDAIGNVVETRWDAVNRRAVRDRRGYATTYAYDGAGRLRHQEDHDRGGAVVYQQWIDPDDATRTETTRDRRGIPTRTVRDGLGRVVEVTRGDQDTVRTEVTRYDASGNVVATVDPNGHETEQVHDGAGRRILEIRDPGGLAVATRHRYDGVGNRLETKGPRGAWAFDLRESFDALGRAVRSEDALGNVTARAFDAAGNKLCERRPAAGDPGGLEAAATLTLQEIEARSCGDGKATAYAYDEASKLVSVRDPLGGEHTFVYDEQRNLVAKQDANGNLTTYRFDALNRRTDEWQHLDAHDGSRIRVRGDVPQEFPAPPDPAAGTGQLRWTRTFDENGNVLTETDPRGLVTTKTYGILDRLARTEFAERLNPELPWTRAIEYVRDGNGNDGTVREAKVTQAGSVVEATTRVFDRLDRLQAELRHDGKGVAYTYDAKGNRRSVTDADDVATSYTYDALDRLETVTAGGGAPVVYAYWPDGRLRSTSFPNGIVEGRCYDDAGRPESVVTARGAVTETCGSSATLVTRFRYHHDANGNRERQTEQRTVVATQALGAEETTTYAFDALDRLTGVLYAGNRAVLYRYDAVGNRVGEREWAGLGDGTVEPVSWSTTPSGATLVRDVVATFNRVDWLVSRHDAVEATRDAAFQWDLAGNLVARTTPQLARTFAWDARNVLVTVRDGDAVLGRYEYDRNGLRVKRWTARESVEYVLDERFVLQELDGSDPARAAYRRYHYGEHPLAVADAAGTRWIGTDVLGSASDLTDGGGRLAARRQYDAWGNHRNGSEPGSADPKLGYTGHQYDPETGLVYARARYYDAELGIFLSRDTYEGELAEAPSLHRYAYAANNPLRFVDPTGRAFIDFLKGAAKGVIKGVVVGLVVGATVAVGLALLPLVLPAAAAAAVASVATGVMVAGAVVGTAATAADVHQTWQARQAGAISDVAADEHIGEQVGSLFGAFVGGGVAGRGANAALGAASDAAGAGAPLLVGAGGGGGGTAAAVQGVAVATAPAIAAGTVGGVVLAMSASGPPPNTQSSAESPSAPATTRAGAEGTAPRPQPGAPQPGSATPPAAAPSAGAATARAWPAPSLETGSGYGPGDPPVRVQGPWRLADLKQALLGHPPASLGRPDLHHGGQVPGGALHEVAPLPHRSSRVLHPYREGLGVTREMREAERLLHWWYRAREQGADELLPDWIYDNPSPGG
jgi:RHS repeat-associated protein